MLIVISNLENRNKRYCDNLELLRLQLFKTAQNLIHWKCSMSAVTCSQMNNNNIIYTTINFTDEFRNVSVMPRVGSGLYGWAWSVTLHIGSGLASWAWRHVATGCTVLMHVICTTVTYLRTIKAGVLNKRLISLKNDAEHMWLLRIIDRKSYIAHKIAIQLCWDNCTDYHYNHYIIKLQDFHLTWSTARSLGNNCAQPGPVLDSTVYNSMIPEF